MALCDFVVLDECLDFIQLVEAVMGVHLIIRHALGAELVQSAP